MTEHHLKYLLEDTFDVRAKWYFIGLCLNLPSSTLDAMKGDINENYTEILKQWLKTGEASMKKFIEALESHTVEERARASRLRQKYASKAVVQHGNHPVCVNTYFGCI